MSRRRHVPRRQRTLGLVIAAVFSGAAVAGCGVPLEDSAQALPPEVIPPPVVVPTQSPSPTPSPTPTPTPTDEPVVELVDFFFVQEDGLVPLVSELTTPADPQLVLNGLAKGPPVETGLRSVVADPLTGSALVSAFVPTGNVVIPVADTTVAVSPAFSSLPPSEQVLLLGQVVISLSTAGYATVSVVDEAGSPLAVPLPDGRLLDRPATALDYATLIRSL